MYIIIMHTILHLHVLLSIIDGLRLYLLLSVNHE